MSSHTAHEPECQACPDASAVELAVVGRAKDIGAFSVRRVLPSVRRRAVGPFVFFDEMGPASLAPGNAMEVRPHPHINLATVTYLFEGEIMHRDSLGTEQAIQPGAVNWMTAGRGITHSERSPVEGRDGTRGIHGLQLWLALPKEHEECDPAFDHYPSETLPIKQIGGARVRVLAGTCFGASSPVKTKSELFYADISMPAGTELTLPEGFAERASYTVTGRLRAGSETGDKGTMMVFKAGATVTLRAELASRFVVLGGAPLDGPRHMWWNFVSSRKERIEVAKEDWRQGRFPVVPGDEKEFIPLPEG